MEFQADSNGRMAPGTIREKAGKSQTSSELVSLRPEQEGRQQGPGPGGPRLRAAARSQAPAVQGALLCSLRGHDLHWGPGSEGTPDFRALGGGGGGTLASLRTGSGGATSEEFLWLLLGGGGGGAVAVTGASVCKDGELRVLVALGVRGGGLTGVDGGGEET